MSIAADESIVATASPHCCQSLDLFERETAARFGIYCGPGKCARVILRGEPR